MEPSSCLVCGDSSTSHPCPVCLARLHCALDALPALYVRLHLEFPSRPTRRPWETQPVRVAWRYRRPLPPLRLSLFYHADACVETVYAWAAAALPQCLPNRPLRRGPLLQHLCRSLAAELPAAVITSAYGCLAYETWSVYQQGRLLLGCEEPARKLTAPCPACDLRSLTVLPDGTAVCRSCRTGWPSPPCI